MVSDPSNKPQHDKTNNMTCAPSELRSTWASTQSDQSLLYALRIAKDIKLLHADSEASDQTGRMPSLICIFAGRTCHFVGFVMLQLICISPIIQWGQISGSEASSSSLYCLIEQRRLWQDCGKPQPSLFNYVVSTFFSCRVATHMQKQNSLTFP